MSDFLKAVQGAMKGETTVDLSNKKKTAVANDKKSLKSALASALKEPEPEPVKVVTHDELGLIGKWSFSSLMNFEKCPYISKLQYVDRVKQKDSEAADRGSAVHDMCEDYVRGNIPELVGDRKTKLEPLQAKFTALKAAFDEGRVTCEENWGIRLDWTPCTWKDKDLWGRAKLDAFERRGTTGVVIDYKTGRRFGNELKHGDQGLSYALYAFYKFHKLDEFIVEFWYLDHGEYSSRTFTRKQLALLHPRMHKRALAMTTAESFPPKSNCESCRFCPYGHNTNKQGVPYGVGVCSFDHYKPVGETESAT